MNQNIFSFVAAIIFLLIAVLHVFRIVYGWSAVIGGVIVPMWVITKAYGRVEKGQVRFRAVVTNQ